MWKTVLEVALLGGIVCLDRIFLQALISRPLVAGSITGLFLHDPLTGMIAGAYIELLWIDRLPIGSYLPPNDSIVAILAAASAILVGRTIEATSPVLITLAILLFLPAGLLGRRLDGMLAATNTGLALRAEEAAAEGNTSKITRYHLTALLRHFVTTATALFVLLMVGLFLIERIVPHFPEGIHRALGVLYCFIPVLGIGVALNTIKVRGALPLFSGLFLVVMVMRYLW
ncbi:MAG: PTS sugar transporter subunit IIC [Deltaproteobacteria bacterium]|nr:PTS sugar transporter subunit IIC [Deltaproteobacteria bacterium]